jgi:hypothetical protein
LKGASILAPAVIVVAAVLIYRGAISAYFFDDDFQWLVGSRTFHPSMVFDLSGHKEFYRPVVELYFGVLTPLFHGSPVLFHLANIALHATNGVLLLALAYSLSGNMAYAFLTALFFVLQPSDMDAIAWVSALAEALSTFFGCLAVLAFVKSRRHAGYGSRVVSWAAFGLALLTHESAVVFLPLLALADWAFINTTPNEGSRRIRRYAPYAIMVVAYLAIDFSINARNYVVTEGHYGIGLHVVTHALDYIVALYVGRRDILNYFLSVAVLIALFRFGSRRVIFAAAWLLIALAPFALFKWGNTSRYLYLPAMGFSMLMAEAVLTIHRWLSARLSRRVAATGAAVITLAIASRLIVFCVQNLPSFVEKADEYRLYINRLKATRPVLDRYARVKISPDAGAQHGIQFLNALVQWEYHDSTITVVSDKP